MTIRRIVCRGLAAATAALAAVPALGMVDTPHAGAATVASVGYWVKGGIAIPTVPKGGMLVGDDPLAAINPSQPPPLPVPLPVAPPHVSIPGPQLNGYTAVSAFRITGLPSNADVTMNLPIAPGSVPPLPPVATIIACPIASSSWQLPPGGTADISRAPPANCGTPSVGRLSANSLSIAWLLPASFQATPGELDIELQPGVSSVPFPYLVAFAAPTPATLKASAGGPVVTPTVAPPDTTAASIPEAVPSNPGSPSVANVPAPSDGASAPAATPSSPSPPAPSARPLTRLAQLGGITDDRSHRIMAVVVLLALAAGWWWLGGRATRAPRRLGALAAEGHAPAELVGGIGRFRRTRADRAPRL